MTNPAKLFYEECINDIELQGKSHEHAEVSHKWMLKASETKYTYHFTWLGRPIIQYPQDILAIQEIIWRTKPDLVIETGIAHGGSLLLHASLLELNALAGGPADAAVLGIDVDIREHNRAAIITHPMSKRVTLLQGSSIDVDIVDRVRSFAASRHNIMLILDSNHTHDHVTAELEAYAGLVSSGSYCIVFDTIIEQMPENAYPDRPWSHGNNPLSAVRAFLTRHPEFEVDSQMDAKLLISMAPGGYLRKK